MSETLPGVQTAGGIWHPTKVYKPPCDIRENGLEPGHLCGYVYIDNQGVLHECKRKASNQHPVCMAEQWHKVAHLLDPQEVDPLFAKLVGCNPGKLYKIRCQPINTLIRNAVIAKHASELEQAVDSDDDSVSVVNESNRYTAEVVNSSTAEFEKFQKYSQVSSAEVHNAVVANRAVLSPDAPQGFKRYVPKSARNTPSKPESVQTTDANLEVVAKKLAKLQVDSPAQSPVEESARVLELETLLKVANEKFATAEKLYESFRVESEQQLTELNQKHAKLEKSLKKAQTELKLKSEEIAKLTSRIAQLEDYIVDK
eukprot:gene27805-34342_t